MDQIVAIDQKSAIGKDGELLFSIPGDLERFKEMTTGAAIVYGRKTMDTFPEGKPLPNRKNYVLTHEPETLPEGCVGVHSLDELFQALQGEKSVFVVGGESVYQELLPYCNHAYVTKVDVDGQGNSWFPALDGQEDWELTEESEPKTWNGMNYQFCTYVNRNVRVYGAEVRKKNWLFLLALRTLIALVLMAVVSAVMPKGHMGGFVLLMVLILALWAGRNVQSLVEYVKETKQS